MQGALLIDKPVGWTSFDCVNYIRRIVAIHEGKKPKNVKVGHTGTLDPFATGLLVLLVGKEYTRRAEELTKQDKTYDVVMMLGEVSSTGDPEGEVMPVDGPVPDRQALEAAAGRFIGEISQIPPAYSAIKVNGQRAYKLARAGKEVTIEARKVTVSRLEITSYTFPEIRFTTRVSSGTYIRTLVEDLGKELGSGAYTSDLRRTEVAGYSVADAVPPEGLDAESVAARLFSL
jgi:tRNA pseudouridine55 synthase